MLDTLAGRSLQFPVAYDWEPADEAGVPTAGASSETPARTEQATPEDVTAFTNVFCERIASGGYEPCYYTNKSMGYTTFDLEALKNYPIWYAEYPAVPELLLRLRNLAVYKRRRGPRHPRTHRSEHRVSRVFLKMSYFFGKGNLLLRANLVY